MSGISTMTAATIGSAMVFGMAQALLGRLKLSVRLWLPALNVAFIPLVLLSGVLLDIYGARPMLAAGSALLAVGLACLGRLPCRWQNGECKMEDKMGLSFCILHCAVCMGGATALGTASIVLMPYAFDPAANAAGSPQSAAALNLGFVFMALGALLTPVLTDILVQAIQLRRTLAVLALLSLVPAFFGMLPDNSLPEHAQLGGGWGGAGNPSALFAGPVCWLAALVLFFYVPLEASISLWRCRLLAERGREEREATALLSGFWAAFVVSRLLAALAQQTFSLPPGAWERAVIVTSPLLAAVVLGNLAGAGQRGRPRGGMILLGLLLGPILPTLLSIVFRAAPDGKGTAFGLAFAAGSLGSAVAAPFVSLRLPVLLAVIVTAIALVLGLMTP